MPLPSLRYKGLELRMEVRTIYIYIHIWGERERERKRIVTLQKLFKILGNGEIYLDNE